MSANVDFMSWRVKFVLFGLVASLFVAVTACAVDAAIVTPAPDEQTDHQYTPTATPDPGSARTALITYLSDLNLLSAEFSESLDDASVIVEMTTGSGSPALSILGPESSLELVLSGFFGRLQKLQTTGAPIEIVRVQDLVIQIVQSEVDWLADYHRVSASSEEMARQVMLDTYEDRLPFGSLALVQDLIHDTLPSHTVPFERVNYQPSELRLTILDEHFIDPYKMRKLAQRALDQEVYDRERPTVQAAIDLLIADNALTSATMVASVAATTDFTAVDFDSGAATVFLYPAYLRQNPTMCSYTWDINGQVLTQTCP